MSGPVILCLKGVTSDAFMVLIILLLQASRQDTTACGPTAHTTRLSLCNTSLLLQVLAPSKDPLNGGPVDTARTIGTRILILIHTMPIAGSFGPMLVG